jgi:hypothetical protein
VIRDDADFSGKMPKPSAGRAGPALASYVTGHMLLVGGALSP